jgi:hydrogenase expression/formation protein HypC
MRTLLPALEAEKFIPLYHHALPTNDACVSLGRSWLRCRLYGKLTEDITMCLGIPGKVIGCMIWTELPWQTSISAACSRKSALRLYLKYRVGQYVIVHAGFALNLLSEDEALETCACSMR